MSLEPRPRPIFIGQAAQQQRNTRQHRLARERRYARLQRACIVLDRQLNQLIVPLVVVAFLHAILPTILAFAQGRHP